MQVEISEKAKEQIAALVRNGSYESESAAIEAALTLLAANEERWWAKVNELVEEGRRDIEEGRFRVLTPETAEALKKEIVEQGLARLAAKNRP